MDEFDMTHRWRRLDWAPIQTGSDGIFDFAESGPRALVYDVWDYAGCVIDRVAWYHEQPARWWLQRGAGAILGEELIDRAQWLDEPLTIFPCPLDYISQAQSVAVVVDWRADLYAALARAPRIICQSPALADRLNKALARPRLRIEVTGARHAA